MVVGHVIGAIFDAITFPGRIVNAAIQLSYEDSYGVPEERFAVPADLDEETVEQSPERLDEIRSLDSTDEPREDERVERVRDYHAIENYSHLFRLVLGPFFVTSIAAVVLYGLTIGAEMAGIVDRQTGTWLWLLAFYPGFAVAANAFPNSEPTDALLERSRQTTSALRFVGYPIVAVSKLINLLQFLWLDAIYAVALYLALALPLGVL